MNLGADHPKRLSDGQIVREIRTQLGMSQSDLALVLGVPQAALSNIESGRSAASGRILTRLTQILSLIDKGAKGAPEVESNSVHRIGFRQPWRQGR